MLYILELLQAALWSKLKKLALSSKSSVIMVAVKTRRI